LSFRDKTERKRKTVKTQRQRVRETKRMRVSELEFGRETVRDKKKENG
jgi:hypothetical protein